MASPSAKASSLGLALLVLAAAAAASGPFAPSSAAAADCNRNGLPDHQEVGDGSVPDCDANGIPDGCDIAAVNFGLAATRRLTVGGFPTQARAADLDADGHVDIAIANDEGTIDFLWSDGAGRFLAVERHETPRFVLSMDAADIDGDGRIDLMGLTHNGLLFFLNQGSRQFAGRLNDLGRMRSLALGDIDLDGNIDVALAAPFEVRILMNPGDGRISGAGESLPVGSDPIDVILAKVDGDEALDVVTANDTGGQVRSGNISVLLGDGGGRFQPARNYAVGERPGSVAAGDLDGDGDADIVTASTSDRSLSLLRGNAAGTPSPAMRIGVTAAPSSAALADLDGDGALDIACAAEGIGGPSVSVLLNNGDGSFPRPVEFPQEQVSPRPALGDLDGNGSLEVAIPIRDAGAVLVLGRVAARYAPDCNGSGVPDGCELAGKDCNLNRVPDTCDLASGASRDCNGNAIPDECEPDCNSSSAPDDCDIAIGRSPDCNGNGTPDECDLISRIDFAPSHPSRTRGLARHVEAVDLDRDGHRDLVRVEIPLGVAALWGRGDGTFQEPAIISASSTLHSATAADLDGDGDLDLAAGDISDGRIVVFLQLAARAFAEGGEFRSPTPVQAGSLAAGDLDGDGNVDIVAAGGARLALALNDGSGSFQVALGLSVARISSAFLHLGDLDGDGRPDVLATGTDSPLVVLWNAGGRFEDRSLIDAMGIPDHAAIADLDGDGGLDFVASALEGFTIALKEDGRSFRVIEVFTTQQGLRGIAAADVDGDGDMDLAMVPGGEDRAGFLVFRNEGNLSATVPLPLAGAAGRLLPPLVPGDHDEDGLVDFTVERVQECPSCPEEPVTLAILNRTLPTASIDGNGDRRPDECQRGHFRRGDAGGDGSIDLGDAVLTLRSLFQGDPAPGCTEAADADNDGKVDLADPILVLDFLFRGGPPPAAPGPPPGPCGLDPDPAGSPRDLGCGTYNSC